MLKKVEVLFDSGSKTQSDQEEFEWDLFNQVKEVKQKIQDHITTNPEDPWAKFSFDKKPENPLQPQKSLEQ